MAKVSPDGELYLSQAISDYLEEHNKLIGKLITAKWYETGSMDGYIRTFAALAERYKQDV